MIEGSQKRFLDLVTASVGNLTHTELLYWMSASSLQINNSIEAKIKTLKRYVLPGEACLLLFVEGN